MEEQETNLKDEVKKLNDNFQQLLASGKVKGVKGKKLKRFEKKRKYVRYIYITSNKEIKIMKTPIDEQITWVDKVPRLATPNDILNWDGDPTIIQPEWSVKPFSPTENYEETVQQKMTSAGYRLLKKAMEEGEVKQSKKMSGAVIFFLIIVLIVVIYFIYSKFK